MMTDRMSRRARRLSRVRSLAALAAALLAAACGGEGQGARRAQSDSAGATGSAATSGRTDSMAVMPGMALMTSDRMMADIEAHMRAMRGAAPDSLRRALPAHRQMVANLMSQMNREMGDMNMTADAAWTALVDSVRADLTRMPELGAEELARMMNDHSGRVERLMRAHGDMMRSMSK